MDKPNILSKKIVVVGNSGVGKTALTLRFVQNSFDPDSPPTIGGSFLAKKISVTDDNGKEDTLSLQIWDTAGQERFRSMVRIYYRGASAAILVFDGTNKESFRSLKDWVVELHSVLGKDIAIAIACNKIDIVDNPDPIMEKAEEYARTIGAKVYATSAKTGVGVENMFSDIAARLLRDHNTEEKSKARESKTVMIKEESSGKQGKKCC